MFIKSINYPTTISFKKVNRDELIPDIDQYLKRNEEQLSSLGFQPGSIVTIPDIDNSNYSQMFCDHMGTIATASLICQPEGPGKRGYLEFLTGFCNGVSLVTKSSVGPDMFYMPSNIVSINYYRVLDVETLLKRHNRIKTNLENKGHKVLQQRDQDITRIQQNIQQTILEHQIEKGVLKYDHNTNRLKGTYRLGISLISHFFSPLGVDISVWSKLFAILFGLLTLGVTRLIMISVPIPVDSQHYLYSLPFGLIFLIFGLLTGFSFIRKSIPWSILSALLSVIYLSQVETVFLNSLDLFLLYVSSAFFGSRLRVFRVMEGSYENLLFPGATVFVLFFIFLLGAG